MQKSIDLGEPVVYVSMNYRFVLHIHLSLLDLGLSNCDSISAFLVCISNTNVACARVEHLISSKPSASWPAKK